MKSLFFVVSLAGVLIAMPAGAQLGPAGVPGAPGLAETDPSVKPPPPTQLAPLNQQEAPHADISAKCHKSKNVERCKERQEARKKALAACAGKAVAERKQCLYEQAQKVDCGKSREPARCEQHKKARELCKDKLGNEHRQCLRDNLAPKK